MSRYILLAVLSSGLLTSTGCRIVGQGGPVPSPLGGAGYAPNAPGVPYSPVDSSGQIPGTAPLAPSTVNFAPPPGGPAAPGSTGGADPTVAQLGNDSTTQWQNLLTQQSHQRQQLQQQVATATNYINTMNNQLNASTDPSVRQSIQSQLVQLQAQQRQQSSQFQSDRLNLKNRLADRARSLLANLNSQLQQRQSEQTISRNALQTNTTNLNTLTNQLNQAQSALTALGARTESNGSQFDANTQNVNTYRSQLAAEQAKTPELQRAAQAADQVVPNLQSSIAAAQNTSNSINALS